LGDLAFKILRGLKFQGQGLKVECEQEMGITVKAQQQSHKKPIHAAPSAHEACIGRPDILT